ncbi:MAG TPA: Rieske 2Fe-2S domain-containing protein [Kofleriaceae bacterium]|nr:Rieske 2Fe-2S domain-containing protein [Kofleriaceae bacterium]
MRVTFLGHAGVQIDTGSTRVVMDGWFTRDGAFDASWFQLPANHHLGDRDWSGIAAAIVSHEHMDHLDPAFLRRLPASVPIYVPQYTGSTLLVRKIMNLVGRAPKVLRTGITHAIGDLELRCWTELSPMNQDSVWAFRHGGRSLVHMVDSRLSQDQLDEVASFLDGKPDLLLVQCAGASWFPVCYDNYDDATKYARGLRKREQKLSYALAVANRLQPVRIGVCAGPPAFLDDSLRFANADPSFPTPGESCAWLTDKGFPGRVSGPLPGDVFDLAAGTVLEEPAIHAEFRWADTAAYVERYAQRMQPNIAAVYAHADALDVPDLDAAVRAHFERMLTLSPYFNQRIDMTLCLDVEGPQGGVWFVDFRAGTVRKGAITDPHHYRYRFHSRWLKRILVDDVPWEDFLLSLRFSAHRDPDVYNDHLLGVLKFNDAASLRAVEQYEQRGSDETVVVQTADGNRYEIQRFCPHAGTALDDAPIEGHILTCLSHHYEFDLDTGKCLSGNCTLRTKKL